VTQPGLILVIEAELARIAETQRAETKLYVDGE